MPKKSPLGDLTYLAQPFSKTTLVTPQGEQEAASRAISDAEVDLYDVDKAKKRIIVLALRSVEIALLSKAVPVVQKAEVSLRALSQFEGTRRIVEWDKRVVDEKQLLEKAESLGKKIVELSKNLPREKVAELEIKAAEALMGMQEKDKN